MKKNKIFNQIAINQFNKQCRLGEYRRERAANERMIDYFVHRA